MKSKMRTRPVSLKRLTMCGGAAIAAGLSTGCQVSQPKHDQALDTIRSLETQKAQLAAEVEDKQRTIDQLRAGRGQNDQLAGDLQTENERLRQELQNQLSQMQALQARLDDMSLGAMIDPRTDQRLADLASRLSGVTYDSERGVLRFASDFTFGSGSADLRPEAQNALNSLGQILQTPEAREYDAIVVGHTDSQVPGQATRDRFGSNRGLSVARAISVVNALGSQGVEGARMQAAGWGEYRPAVPNAADGNTPANRRVEVFLRPTTANVISGGGSDGSGGNAGSIGIDDAETAGSRIDSIK